MSHEVTLYTLILEFMFIGTLVDKPVRHIDELLRFANDNTCCGVSRAHAAVFHGHAYIYIYIRTYKYFQHKRDQKFQSPFLFLHGHVHYFKSLV